MFKKGHKSGGKPKGKINEKQRRFIENYIGANDPSLVGNAVASVRAAGYSNKAPANTAALLMKNPAVKAEIDKALSERRKMAQMTLEHQNKVLYDIINAGHKKVEEASVRDTLEALKEISKRDGLYAAQKQEITNLNIETVDPTHKLSAEEQLKELEKIKEAIVKNKINLENLNIKKTEIN